MIDPQKVNELNKHLNLAVSSTPDILPDTQSYLDLCSHPELMEHLTVTELKSMFEKSGYSLASSGDITVGIGRKLGSAYAHVHNAALIRTADEKLAFIHFGTSSTYNIAIVADAAERADKGRLLDKIIEMETSLIPCHFSQTVHELKISLSKLREMGEVPEEGAYKLKEAQELMRAEADAKRNEWIPRCGPNPGYFA